MPSDYTKPLPIIDSDTAPYWNAARDHRLSLMRCVETGKFIHPPGPGSPFTGGSETEWLDLGENITGHLYSYIVVNRAFGRGFGGEVPYVVGLVDVDQAPGVRITANVLGGTADTVSVGMKLRMVWADVTPEVTLPQWEVIV